MPQPEQIELDAHRAQLDTDVRALVDKYLAIAEWDVPGINAPLSRQLIIGAIRQALDRMDQGTPQTSHTPHMPDASGARGAPGASSA